MGSTKKEILSYSTDASRMNGIVNQVYYPKSIIDIQKIIKSTNFDIVSRGAGSGLVGGAIPKDSIVIDLCNMNKIINFNPAKRTVHVDAGVSLKELNEKLEATGFEFPIDPSNQGISTIGGMVATNSSGDRSFRYGSTKDWLEEIEFVNGKGELVKTSKADLNDVCGMEGITGVIVSIKLRVTPKLKKSVSLFQTNNLDEVLSVSRRLKSEKDVLMIELFPPFVSKLLNFPEKYNLIIEFGTLRGKIQGSEYENLFRIRNRAYYDLSKEGYYNFEDPKLFFDKIKEFLMFLENNNIPYIGHIGSGIINPFFKDNEKKKREEVIDFIKKSNAKLGNFGFGLLRKHFLESFELKLIERVKHRHDPNNRMNRGKVIGEFIQYKKLDSSIKLDKKEFEPNLGEEMSAQNFLKEIGVEEEYIPISESQKIFEKNIIISKEQPLIPETDFSKKKFIQEFVKKAIDDTKKQEETIEKTSIIPTKSEEEYIRDRIKDYEQTYDSELVEERKKVVEEFAKNIPREIVKTEIMLESLEKNEEFKKPNVSVDYKEIQKIMTNRISPEQQIRKEFDRDYMKRFEREKFEDTDQKSNLILKNKASFLSDFSPVSPSPMQTSALKSDYKSEGLDDKKETKPIDSDSRLSSQEEKDLINKIMTNKFGKGFADIKKDNINTNNGGES